MEQEGGVTGSTGGGASAASGAPSAPRTCAWCGTEATPEATSCSSCGAALAQRESIGDLAIPGLTSVDAALQDYDKRPLHLRGPSPSQGMAPALIVGAMAGGPIGLAAIGGVAAVAAAEYMGSRRPGDRAALEEVGKPSEVALQALEHLNDGAGEAGSSSSPAANEPEEDAAAADHGMSIWRDLPPVAHRFEKDEEEGDPDGR